MDEEGVYTIDEEGLYAMKVGEKARLVDGTQVVCVPGGWVYLFTVISYTNTGCAVFVPIPRSAFLGGKA